MRRLDVLTLGMSSSSRWNPLYRWWARRNAVANLTVALKALTLRHGGFVDDARPDEQTIILGTRELDRAAKACGLIEPLAGGRLRIRIDPTVEPPRGGIRILWWTRRA